MVRAVLDVESRQGDARQGAVEVGEATLQLRQRESVIGINTLMTLPLTFLSAAFMPLALAPDWIETAARFNPVNWAVEAGREALLASPDWTFIAPRIAGLAVLTLLSMAWATRAFRTYQRSI